MILNTTKNRIRKLLIRHVYPSKEVIESQKLCIHTNLFMQAIA